MLCLKYWVSELQLLLPKSLDELKKHAKFAPAKPELVQLPTLGPRVMRELPPLFIIPGLSGIQVIRDLANQLLYPTFYTNLPCNSMNLHDMAVDLAQVKETF